VLKRWNGVWVFGVSVRRGEKRLVEGIGRGSERRALLFLLSQQRACRKATWLEFLLTTKAAAAPLVLLDSMLGC